MSAPRGVSAPGGGGGSAPGGSAPGGVCSRECIPACTEADTLPPCGQNSWHTLVKILPWPNFVAAGNNKSKNFKTYFKTGNISSNSGPWVITLVWRTYCLKAKLIHIDPRWERLRARALSGVQILKPSTQFWRSTMIFKCQFKQKSKNNYTLVFRWFKFTLKPPYSIRCGKLRLAIWYTSFWTFWSNLDTKDLETYPRTYSGHFWNMSLFDDSRAVWVLFRKWVGSENQSFLDEIAIVWPLIGSVLGGEVPKLNHGPICFPIQNT